MAEAEDRTEAASPRQLARAREEGRVPLSREASGLAGLGAASLALMLLGPGAAETLALRLRGFLAGAGSWDVSDGGAAALHLAVLATASAAGPVVLAALLGGAMATLLQTGFLFNAGRLMPDFTRLNPGRGLRRIAGMEGLTEAARAVAKLGLLSFVAWKALAADWPVVAQAVAWQPQILPDRLMRMVVRLVLMVLGAQAVLAVLDLLWVRLRHARSLRMSREELRQEAKETDGNPQVKQRLHQLRRSRARRRMMAAVPKATVVITNPTHFAVALAYDRGASAAPRVVAKGVDEAAARIREVARDNGVPLVANPPLARALYRVELDEEVPAEHFQAVAEIIAYVWRLNRRAGAARKVPDGS